MIKPTRKEDISGNEFKVDELDKNADIINKIKNQNNIKALESENSSLASDNEIPKNIDNKKDTSYEIFLINQLVL